MSKDAARALRKEIKYGSEEARLRAVKLLVIIWWNSGERFKRES
jgi:hypothetical protein